MERSEDSDEDSDEDQIIETEEELRKFTKIMKNHLV